MSDLISVEKIINIFDIFVTSPKVCVYERVIKKGNLVLFRSQIYIITCKDSVKCIVEILFFFYYFLSAYCFKSLLTRYFGDNTRKCTLSVRVRVSYIIIVPLRTCVYFCVIRSFVHPVTGSWTKMLLKCSTDDRPAGKGGKLARIGGTGK